MTPIPFFLADEEINQILASWRFTDPSIRGAILVFGAIGLVTLLALFWAVFLRRRRRRHSHHHSHQHTSVPTEAPEATNSVGDAFPPPTHRKRRHSRHRSHSRNPPLAETRGLPPVRTEGPPEPLP